MYQRETPKNTFMSAMPDNAQLSKHDIIAPYSISRYDTTTSCIINHIAMCEYVIVYVPLLNFQVNSALSCFVML